MAFDAMILLAVLVSLIGGTRIVERTVTEAVSQREDDNEATIQAIKDRGGEVRPDPLHPNEPGLLLVGFFGEKFMDDDLKLLKGLRSVGSLLVSVCRKSDVSAQLPALWQLVTYL